jgi:hypothetical protein
LEIQKEIQQEGAEYTENAKLCVLLFKSPVQNRFEPKLAKIAKKLIKRVASSDSKQ